MKVDLNVMPHTAEFVTDTATPNVALVAGVGAGKTIALQQKAILLSVLNPGCLGILTSPTFAMLERNILNMRNGLPVQLAKAGIPFEFRGGNTFHLRLPGGHTSEIECTHAGTSISGRTAAWFGIDEVDLMHTSDALETWDILSARLRDPNGKVFQGFCASTPEGRKFLWQKFEQDLVENPALADRFKLYRATTYDNFYLPPGYIANLEAQYDPKRLRAHLMGEFVSLTEGLVYYNFDRVLNNTTETIRDKEHLHVGIDFNANGMSACVFVIRDSDPYLLAEVMGSENTPALIDVLLTRFKGHPITCYPDATGKDVRSTTSSETDHNLLRKAGFIVNTTPGNPLVRDRIGSVTALICDSTGKRRLKVNVKACPITTGCLEQHTYGDDGAPTKRRPFGKMKLHIDGPPDAMGYFLHRRYPSAPRGQANLRLLGY